MWPKSRGRLLACSATEPCVVETELLTTEFRLDVKTWLDSESDLLRKEGQRDVGFKLAGELGQLVGKAGDWILRGKAASSKLPAQGFLEFSPLPWAPCQQSA